MFIKSRKNIQSEQKHLPFFEIVCGKNCRKWAVFDIKGGEILAKD
jgi:hypothetical protein